MNIDLTMRALIDRAKERSGLSFGQLAEELGRNQTRISEWRTGKAKPETSEIAYFADKAGFEGIEVFEAVAEIEQQLRPAYARVWQKALEQAVPKSLFQLFGLSSKGPNTGRCGPYFGWFGSCA